jgi:WD40 repeat protein
MEVWRLPERQLRFVRSIADNLNWLIFSPDGQTLAGVNHDHTVKLWNVETGQEMLTFTLPGGCFQAEFSGDGRTLAVGTYVVRGTNQAFNTHLFRAPSLAEIAAADAKTSGAAK